MSVDKVNEADDAYQTELRNSNTMMEESTSFITVKPTKKEINYKQKLQGKGIDQMKSSTSSSSVKSLSEKIGSQKPKVAKITNESNSSISFGGKKVHQPKKFKKSVLTSNQRVTRSKLNRKAAADAKKAITNVREATSSKTDKPKNKSTGNTGRKPVTSRRK